MHVSYLDSKDDEGWIEEPEEETVAPTRMSKLDAKNSKKKEKKAKKVL